MTIELSALPELPELRPLRLEDRDLIEAWFERYPPVISEFTFTNLCIWKHYYQLKVGRRGDAICFLAEPETAPPLGRVPSGQAFFFPPVGEAPLVETAQALLDFMKSRGLAPRLARVPEGMARQLQAAGYEAELDRDHCDYLYLARNLIFLPGRKYQGKRNRVAKFKFEHNYEYRPLTEDLIPECLALGERWLEFRRDHLEERPSLLAEWQALRELFADYSAFNVAGAVVLIEGKVQAFEIGEKLNPETFVIHFEKASSDFPGLYQAMNQLFCENEAAKYSYVNREQDLGLPGLRRAKLSYHPDHLVHKYIVTRV